MYKCIINVCKTDDVVHIHYIHETHARHASNVHSSCIMNIQLTLHMKRKLMDF